MKTNPRDCPASGINPALIRLFENPLRDFSPTPLWWWSGEEVSAERMEWQMRRFAAGGIYNLVVINLAPAGPQYGVATDSPRWFSWAWWERFVQACALAEELGMKLWVYDQIGFSGANLQGRVSVQHPWACGQTLRCRPARFLDGELLLEADETLIALFDAQRKLVGQVSVASFRETAGLQAVVAVPSAFDYLNPDAVALLLDEVYGELERRVPQYLGNVIAGTFQDELPPTNAWTDRFLDEFIARKGYDLRQHMLSLFGETDVRGAKVRSDYYAVRAQLVEEALFVPMGAWHRAHGMQQGADQSEPARSGVPIQSTQIYTDYFRTMRHVNACGSDHEGDSKVHQSLAELYGHKRIWLEAFHSSGWGGTLEETWDWLLPFVRRGANLYNPHASYFSTVGGWFEWAPPATDWRQPYWRHYPQFSKAVARVCSLMCWGKRRPTVAVLHPTATMQASLPLDTPLDFFQHESFDSAFTDVEKTQRVYLELVGKDDWFCFQPSALDQAGIEFTIVDDDSLGTAAVEPGKLLQAGQEWQVVLLPSAAFLAPAVIRKLLDFLDAGGSVFCVGEAPSWATGFAADDSEVLRLVSQPGFQCFDTVQETMAALAGVGQAQLVRSKFPIQARTEGASGIALVLAAYPNAMKHPVRGPNSLDRVRSYDFDRRRYAQQVSIRVGAELAVAEVWNPATGERRAASISRDGGCSVIEADTGGAPAVLFAWEEKQSGSPAQPICNLALGIHPDARAIDISDGWQGELIQTLDNTWGDLTRLTGKPQNAVEIWTFNVDERHGWEESWATLRETARTWHGPISEFPGALTPEQCEAVLSGEKDLAGSEWERAQWSDSRGRRRDWDNIHGLKGRVKSEFIATPTLTRGMGSVVRTITSTTHRGPADLVLLSPARCEAWWNGTPLVVPQRYSRVIPIAVDREQNVLEYRMFGSEEQHQPWFTSSCESGFSFFPPGGFDARPEFICADIRIGNPGVLIFSAPLPAAQNVQSAKLVLGCAKAATIKVDGRTIARQEKVEYYETEFGAQPQFFAHDLLEPLAAGGRELQIFLDNADGGDVLWVDLAITRPGGTSVTLVSDENWIVSTEQRSANAVVVNRFFGSPESAFAISRSHTLPNADWLLGPPERGSKCLDWRATDSVKPKPRQYRALLPAGTIAVAIPASDLVQATLNGIQLKAERGKVTLSNPLQEPAYLEWECPPSFTSRAEAALVGPLEVSVQRAPITLGNWQELGLKSWSGGVRYSRELEVDAPHGWRIDLGDVRGSVELRLDGEMVGSAFCAPFSFSLPPLTGTCLLEIDVYGTLAPYLSESAPTTYALPNQLPTGLFGPVKVTYPAGSVQKTPHPMLETSDP
ncbi:MAG: hypothetical protein LBR21_05520 [Propionibacteriaceae bacterium]|jgi:hypothetical protein|nr:hypothetical protein [Propionibacteriaceae bacterium]